MGDIGEFPFILPGHYPKLPEEVHPFIRIKAFVLRVRFEKDHFPDTHAVNYSCACDTWGECNVQSRPFDRSIIFNRIHDSILFSMNSQVTATLGISCATLRKFHVTIVGSGRWPIVPNRYYPGLLHQNRTYMASNTMGSLGQIDRELHIDIIKGWS